MQSLIWKISPQVYWLGLKQDFSGNSKSWFPPPSPSVGWGELWKRVDHLSKMDDYFLKIFLKWKNGLEWKLSNLVLPTYRPNNFCPNIEWTTFACSSLNLTLNVNFFPSYWPYLKTFKIFLKCGQYVCKVFGGRLMVFCGDSVSVGLFLLFL